MKIVHKLVSSEIIRLLYCFINRVGTQDGVDGFFYQSLVANLGIPYLNCTLAVVHEQTSVIVIQLEIIGELQIELVVIMCMFLL